MSLNALKVPLISITPENEHDDNDYVSLMEALTDTENLDIEQSPRHKRLTKSKLKIKIRDEITTDLEDFEASDCEGDDAKIVDHRRPFSIESLDLDPGVFEETYKIKTKNAKGKRKLKTQSSTTSKNAPLLKLDDFEDGGVTDCEDLQASDMEDDYECPEIDVCPEIFADSINIEEKIRNNSALGFSPAVTPKLMSDDEKSPKVDLLTILAPKLDVLTDTELVYSDSEMEDTSPKRSKSKLRKRRSRGKKQEAATDVEEIDFSENDSRGYRKNKKTPAVLVQPKKNPTDLIFKDRFSVKNLRNDQDSDDSDDLGRPNKNVKSKRSKNTLQVVQIENEGLTDVDQCDFDTNIESDYDQSDHGAMIEKLEEIASSYGRVSEENSIKKTLGEFKSFDTIDTDFESETLPNDESEQTKSDYNVKFVESPNLTVPKSADQPNTDVESVYSSDDENYKKIPVAILKRDVDETSDESLSDFEITVDYPDVVLPEPFRKVCLIKDDHLNRPTVKILPLDQHFDYLKISPKETQLTDVENISDYEETLEVPRRNRAPTPELPTMEGGYVDLHEKLEVPSKKTHEQLTDTEEVILSPKKTSFRKQKKYVTTKKLDVEYINLSDESNLTLPVVVFNSNFDTDVEVISNDDDSDDGAFLNEKIDFVRALSTTPIQMLENVGNFVVAKEKCGPFTKGDRQMINTLRLKKRKSSSYSPMVTDTEDVTVSADEDLSVDRAETATPSEMILRELDSVSSSRVQLGNYKKIDVDHPDEMLYVKYGEIRETYTDIEEVAVSDDEHKKNKIVLDFQQGSVKFDSRRPEWDASIKKGGDVPSATTVTTTQEEKLKDAAQEDSSDRKKGRVGSLTYESVLLMNLGHNNPAISPENPFPNDSSNSSKVSSYTQIDAMLERMLSAVEEQEKYFIDESDDDDTCVNSLELVPSSDALIEIPIKKSIHVPKTYETTQEIHVGQFEQSPRENSANFDSLQENINNLLVEIKNDEEAAALLLENVSEDDDCHDDCLDDYEPIDIGSSKTSDIWYEGAYRNLSIVPEEDEDTNSTYSLPFPQKPFCEPYKTSSSDSSDYEEDVVKAEVKLLVKTSDRGNESIEIRSVREFMEKPIKSNSKKPVFTLQRLFVRTPETENDLGSSKNLSRSRSELLAAPTDNFPLKLNEDHIDLYANTPFYPCYTNPTLLTTFTTKPNDTNIPEGYCDWFSSEEQKQGISTTTRKYLDSDEDALINLDLKRVADKTNAFIKSELVAEPYDVNTDRYFKEVAARHAGSLTETADFNKETVLDEKKSKKGFFGTLRNIMGKSTDHSDSDSEKSPKVAKKEKKKKHKEKPKDKDKTPTETPTRKPKLPTPDKSVETEENVPVETKILKDQIDKEKPEDQKSPESKQKLTKITVVEEVTKTFQPAVVEGEQFSITVDPTKKEPEKKEIDKFTFNIDDSIDKIEKEILEKSPILSEEHITKPIINFDEQPTMTSKDDDYEDIEAPVISKPPDHLETLPEYITKTEDDLKTETDKKIKISDSPRTKQKQGVGLFKFLKKSSKDVEESDDDSKQEIIEKQDKELSKEKPRKTEAEKDRQKKVDSENEDDDSKKGGLFSIFTKKGKTVETSKDKDKAEEKPEIATEKITTSPPTEKQPPNDVVQEKSILDKDGVNYKLLYSQKSLEDMENTASFLKNEISVYEDDKVVAPKEAEKHVEVPKQEKEKLEETPPKTEEGEKKSIFSNLFGKKTKKSTEKESETEDKKSEAKTDVEKLSAECRKEMEDSCAFLETEIKNYEDKKDIVTTKMTEEENVEKTKTEQQEETIIVKKEVEEEDKKSFFTNIFGKKTKKSVEREIVKEETEAKDAKQPEITNYKELLSDECKKNVEDTNNFLKTEVENYEDSKISFSKEEIKSPRQEQEQQPQQQSEETHKVEDGEKKSIFSNIFGKKTKKSVEREIVKTKTEKDETKTEIEVKEERKTEIPPLSEECKKNIKDSSDFLQTEIVNYEDVERAPPTSPEKQQRDAKLKEKEEKKSAVKSPEETEEEDGEKKSIFPSIFSKKTKKSAEREIVKTKPEVEEQQKKEMQSLSDECKKNIKDSSEFLQTEVANYEDSRVSFVGKPAEIQTQKEEVGEIKSPEKIPIKQDDGEKKSIFSNIFGKKSKKSVEREIVETKTEGDKAQPLTKPETVVLSEECKKDMEDTTKFLQNELINYEDSKPPLVTKEKEEKPQKVEDAQKSEEKEVKSPEEIVHKEDESEKKSIFSNIFGKKTKKSVEREIVKTKTDVEEAEKKKEGLSDECKKDMEDTTKFIKTEVDNYEDSKIIQECKIAQQKIEENVETKQEEIAHKEDTEKKSIFAGVFGKKTKKSVDKDTKTESDEKSPKKKITKEDKDKDINIQITVSDETKTKTVLDDTQNEIDKHEEEEKDKKTEKTAEEAPPKDDGEKKSILSNLLGKKHKKSTEKEAPKTNVEDETVIDSKKETYKQLYSEEFKKDLENVANFIQGEITNYEDGKSEIAQQVTEGKKEKETEGKIVEKPKQELAKGTEEEEEKKSLFSVFGKKTKKSVEREIVSTAKPEQEESKKDKEKSEEIDDNEKKDGFFGIFKKPKVEVTKRQSETVPEVSSETKPPETETAKEKTEIIVTDVKETEEQPQLELQTKLDDEDYDSSDSKSGGLFSFFSKKGKKESSPKIQKKKFKKHQKAKSVEDKEHRKSPKMFSLEETMGAIDVASTTENLMGGLKEGTKETVERIKDKTATVKDDLAKTAEETTTKTNETLAATADKIKDESKKGEDSKKEKMATEESKIKTTVTDKIEETHKSIEDEMKNLKETSDAIEKESVTNKETITEKVDKTKTSVDLDKDIKATIEETQKEIKHTSEIVESKKEKTEQFIQNGVDLVQKEAEKTMEKIKADVQSVDDNLQSKLDKIKIETTKTVQEIEKSVGEKTTVIKGEIEIKSDEIKVKTKLLEDTIKDNLKFATSGFTTTFQETGKSVKDKIEDTKEEISVKLADETKIVEDKISTGESVVKETILQTQKSVDDKIKKTAKMVEETVKVKSEEIKESVDAEKDKIKQAAQEAQKSAETVKDGAKEVADKLCEKTREAKDTIKESAKKQKKKTEEALQDKAKSIESEMEEKIQKIDDEIKKTKEKAEELSKSLLSNLEKKLEETKDFGHKTKDAIKEEQKKIATEAQKIKETTKDKLVDAKKSAEDKIKEDVKVASKEFEAAAERTKTSTEKAIKTLSDEIEKKKKDVKEVGDEIGSKVDVVKDVLKEQEKKITSATQEIEKSAKDLTKVAQKEIKDTESRVEEATKSAKDALEEKVKTGEECLKNTAQEILIKTEEKKKEAKDVVDKVKTEAETATEKIKDTLSDAKDKAKSVKNAGVEKIEKTKDELSKTTQQIIQEKKDATKETVDGLKDRAEMIGGEIKEDLKETETKIKDTTKTIAEEIKEKKDTIDEKLKKEKEQIETIMTESETSAKKFVKSTDQGFKEMVKEAQITVETKIDEIKDKRQSLEEDAEEKLQKAQEKVSATVQDVKHTTGTAEKDIRDAADKLDVKVQRAEGKIEDTLKGGQQKMKDATEETATKMKSMGESLKSAMEDTRKTADCVVESAKKGVEEDTKRRLETAENELKILMEESEKSTNNLIEAFKSKVTETESYVNGKTDSTKSKGLLSALSETPKAKSVDIAEIKQEKETSGVKSSGKATEDFISADNSFGSMTRAVSDHIDFMKDEDNTSKISETNIDLSNLPPEEDYVPKKQKFGGGSYVTSPTMQRRYKSTKLSTKDRPELLDISNMPVDSSSDEDNYIVTEPPEEESDMKEPRKEPRKPLFHLESEENEETKVEESVPGSLDKIAEYEKKVSITTDSDFKEIEKKLQDLDEALGDLENLEFKSGDDKKLRRVERKFERMASEVIDKEVSESKKEKLSTPEIEEKRESEFQKIVSQLSAEEVSECQKDYVSLWDEHTFSPSDEWDSKTPDSQLDAQELPQGDVVYMGPVTLNKDNLVNKAGIEVDVIPVMRSPCSSPLPRKKTKSERARSEMGFRSNHDSKKDRGSLPDLQRSSALRGSIVDIVMSMDTGTFLSQSYDGGSTGSLMTRSLGSSESLSKGAITNAVVNWLQKSSPFSSTSNINVNDEDCSTSSDLVYTRDIYVTEDEAFLIVPPKEARKSIENSCGQLTELTPKPKPRTAKTPDETQETLEKETTESSVVDETLDYSERKKFWENFTKEKEGIITTKKRMSLHEEPSIDKASLVKKRTSVHEVSLTPPVPKPRHVLQTKDTKSIDESTESLPADVTDDSTKPISEYQASYQHPSRFSNAGLEKTDSLDSELEFSTQNQSCENTGYISDSGDVEHYISDSEIEDRVPQIRERQMSVCEPYPAARKTIYERSASLPTEDLYEVSARSAKLRKQYYEQQIKKEMIAENLMTESEDEPSPELKTLDNLQIKQEEPPGIRSVPEKATEDEKESSLATVRDLAKTFGGTILKKEPTKTPQMESEPLAEKDDSPKSVKDLAKSFEKFDKAPKKGQKSSESDQSVSETDQDNLVKEDSVSKPSDSMEVHVDKSEIEDSEKLADLDQDATDLETKSLDSLNATETSPKLIASAEDNIPEITVTLSGKQRSEESDEEKDQEIVDKKVESPINIPEEHVQDTIWEVSVESHLEEQATEMVSLETSKIDMKSVQLQKAPKEDTISPDDGIEIEKISPTHDSDTYTNDKLTPDDQLRPKSTDVFCETERDEEFSGSVRDESDLGSEIHQDHSDSYASDKIKSESHSDIEKIILESLHQQHVDPEEAKKIASALIEDIEKEIQKRNELELDLAASPEKVQVSDYLRQLAETKGLDQREVELVESVLARRQRELAKLARGDTQASSMEITDEDLRYSGAEIDYNNVLEQQIDQLEAEKSKTFDKIEEEINAFRDKTTTIKETDEEKYEEILKDTQHYEDGERKTHKIDMHKKIKESTKEEKTAVDSIITESKVVDRKQETIVEEHDETLSDTLKEDTKTSASTIEEITHKTDTKKEIVEKTDKDKIVKDETITEKSLDESKILGGYTKEFSATSKSDDGVKEVFEKETEEIKTTTSTKKDTQVENVLEIADDLEEQVEKTHTKISSSSTIVDHAQKESKTVSSKILGEIVEADLDKLIASGKLTVDQEKGDVMKTVVETHQEIKRTSSDESKSSQEESAKSPEEQFSTCSSGRKGDSDTVNKVSEKHGVVLRKTKSARDDTSSSSSNLKIERKSGVDFDSSSGESHYQSFELDSGKSRPCSSDVEGLLAAGSSEYESALTSQDVSARSHLTSAEYHTAVSSLGSKESMRSLDSESSGNLASVEVSEASETLVPSTSDLDDFVEAKSDLKQLHGRQSTEMSDSEILEIDDSLNDEESKPTVDTQSKMKRSHEMTFQPEPKVLVPDSPQSESTHDIDERFGTSLDEGSVLSVSLSSTSSAAALRTVIELSRADSERLDGMTLSGTSDQITLEDLEKADVSTCTIPQPNDQISSVTMITSSSISENGVLNVSTQVSSQTHPVEKTQKEETTEEVFEPKKKGHRRYESTSFIPQMIPSRAEVERISELAESDKYTQLSNKEISSDEKKDIDESYETEADQGFHKDMREGRFLDQAESEHKVTTEKDETKVCQVRKLSGTSSEKSSFESEAEAEAAFSMVAHVSPAHKIKQICPILEDEDAEKHELETRERAQKEYEKRRAQMYDQSPGAVPDIKITQHMTPLVDRAFHYPDLELEEKEEALKETPETPASNSSKSSEETDQGREYVLDDTVETITESKSEAPTAIEKTVQETDSPNSDSFELIEKPDPLDDFVVIEEVAKEAQEHDTEGKSVKMPSQKYVRKHDEEVEELLVKSAPATVMTDLKYYPEGSSSDELGFEFEDSPPQLNQKQQQKSSRDYVYEYDRELEANKKWIEQQFQGDQAAMAAAGYGYEMDFERGPLEDIKEEDVNDFDPTSSRIGSLGSQKESGGSLGSVKDSFSSTPEYDVLAGRKYFTRSGEHDDVSMSSLQEFENLERAMSLENRRCHQGSQDSSSNGSFGKRYYASKSGQGDDVSVNSLKEFEGLEKACIAAHKIEVKVKEEEAMLAQIEEGQESIASESESCETISGTDKKLIPDSDEEDYEKRMFEIDEIIRQAQTNVERFIDIKDGDKTESIGRGDSFEEVSKVPDLDLDAPIARVTTKVQWAPSDDVMITSTDSLDLKQEKPSHHDSTDSLDQKTTACDIMTASTDSIEFQAQKSKDIATDSIETKEDRYMVSSDSLELATGTNFAALSDSIDEDGSRIGHDHSTSSTGRDFSSSVKEEIPVDFKNQRAEYMLGSTDSLDPSSSTATHATYQYETDSVYSGSFTSGGSNTMVSSTDTIDPNASHSVDLSVAVRKVWFDDNSEFTTEYFDDSSKPYVTEVIEPCPDDEFSHTIHRRVELPPEIRKITFRGTDADQQLQQFIENFGEGEHTQETEEVDEAGNVHVRKIVQKRYVVKTDEKQPTQGISKKTYTDSHGTKTIYTQQFEFPAQDTASAVHSLLTSIAGDSTAEESKMEEPATSGSIRAQATRRRQLRYDISLDDQTEVDPREHDWRFYLPQHAEGAESSGQQESRMTQQRTVADQHQLSEEMKELLKHMEEESKK